MLVEMMLFVVVLGFTPLGIYIVECAGLIDDNIIYNLDNERQ